MLPTSFLVSTRENRHNEYYTPPYAFDVLSPYLPKDKIIWESAWGQGHLASYLQNAGFQVVGGPTINFYQRVTFAWDVIVTNPPFDDIDSFLLYAYRLGKPFAFLMHIDALGRQFRVSLYRRYGIELLVPTKRIDYLGKSCENGGYCPWYSAWFCWKLGLPSPLTFAEV